MAELTPKTTEPPTIKEAAVANSEVLLKGPAGSSPLNPPEPANDLIFVRYLDHVLYNRNYATAMKPQIREAIGWLVYDCESYVILSWDRDAEPPTLHGGDPKASGLVLLKSDIINLVTFTPEHKRNIELNLKSKQCKEESEFAFRPSERKTQSEGVKKK